MKGKFITVSQLGVGYDCYQVQNRGCPGCVVTSVGERAMGYDNEVRLSRRYRKFHVRATVSQVESLEAVSS
jgi:hypothetical protein